MDVSVSNVVDFSCKLKDRERSESLKSETKSGRSVVLGEVAFSESGISIKLSNWAKMEKNVDADDNLGECDVDSRQEDSDNDDDRWTGRIDGCFTGILHRW